MSVGTQPVRVTVVTGGPTLEYKSSLDSAVGILEYRDALGDEFRLEPCFITHAGVWLDTRTSEQILETYQSGTPEETIDAIEQLTLRGRPTTPWQVLSETSVVFHTICGTLGEDGVIAGLCRALRKSYVGSNIFTSVVQYDKAACNALLRSVGIAQTPQVVLLPGDEVDRDSKIDESVPLPWIVKPSNGGCSIGISLVRAVSELPAALAKVQEFYPGSPALVEAAVQDALEVDVAVMKDLTGQIVTTPCGVFEASDQTGEEGSAESPTADVPASAVPPGAAETMQALTRRIYQVLRATSWLKVDFFYRPSTGVILVNEINAVPNTSRGSLTWKLWEAAGLSPLEVIRRLIQLALQEGLEHGNSEQVRLLQRSQIGRNRIRIG